MDENKTFIDKLEKDIDKLEIDINKIGTDIAKLEVPKTETLKIGIPKDTQERKIDTKNKQEVLMVNDILFKIITCKDCSGKFWTQKSYILHWSCNGRLRCSYCFCYGHTIATCDLRIDYDKTPINHFVGK